MSIVGREEQARKEERGKMRTLLSNLFLLDGLSEFLSERHVRLSFHTASVGAICQEKERTNDGNVLEDDIKLSGSFEKIFSNPRTDDFSLGDEFSGIELGYGSFKDFISDGRKDSFVVIESE